jgi:signal transduction histidine kinase
MQNGTKFLSNHKGEFMSLILTLDLGITLAKCVIYDESGRAVSEAQEEMKLKYPGPGMAEQPSDDFYQATCRMIKKAISSTEVNKKDIICISADCQMGGVVTIDENYEPATYFDSPLDNRASKENEFIHKNYGDLTELQEEYLTDVHQSSRHLLSLINDILDLSKVEAGKFELELSDVEIKLLLQNSLNMVKEKAMKSGIKLLTSIDGIPEIMRVDERKLKQIIYNLLYNAVKFTDRGGEVCLRANRVDSVLTTIQDREGYEGLQINKNQIGTLEIAGTGYQPCLRVSVSDTGIGVKQEDRDRIFQPFEQVDGSPSRRYQGTGLGLALTKRLVEIHGGKIWVESKGDGSGSTFSFLIPILKR